MDISDILADLDASSLPQTTADLHALTRHWVAERTAPELLPWPEPLIKRTMARIARQIEAVEVSTGAMEPKANFRVVVLQTELERWKFLVRSLVRARLAKVCVWCEYSIRD
jgi:GINS complex subunit 4